MKRKSISRIATATTVLAALGSDGDTSLLWVLRHELWLRDGAVRRVHWITSTQPTSRDRRASFGGSTPRLGTVLPNADPSGPSWADA
jgi:hypothetical protein